MFSLNAKTLFLATLTLRNKESISLTFYTKLLCVQILKALDDTDNLTEILCSCDLYELDIKCWWNWHKDSQKKYIYIERQNRDVQ